MIRGEPGVRFDNGLRIAVVIGVLCALAAAAAFWGR